MNADRELQAAPPEAYSDADRAFFAFWYGHMQADQMRLPLASVSQATARYIWDAACAAAEIGRAMPC